MRPDAVAPDPRPPPSQMSTNTTKHPITKNAFFFDMNHFGSLDFPCVPSAFTCSMSGFLENITRKCDCCFNVVDKTSKWRLVAQMTLRWKEGALVKL